MNRFKEHKDQKIIDKIKSMVGEADLSSIIDANDPIEALCLSFEKNLREMGRFVFKFMMRDENNIRDHAFFFCGNNSTGFSKIKAAMWKADPIYGNSFSAHKEASKGIVQKDLFSSEPYTYPLSREIMLHFAGKIDVPVKEIFKWIDEENEVFLEKHARIELENLLQENLISIQDPSEAKRKRRKGDWPERLLISFSQEVPSSPS